MDQHVSSYKLTVYNVKYVDSNIDYDGYRNYIKDNDNRRAMASFLMMLAARKILVPAIIISIIEYF